MCTLVQVESGRYSILGIVTHSKPLLLFSESWQFIEPGD